MNAQETNTLKEYPLKSKAKLRDWQNPAYREKVLTERKHVIDTRMKERLRQLARQAQPNFTSGGDP